MTQIKKTKQSNRWFKVKLKCFIKQSFKQSDLYRLNMIVPVTKLQYTFKQTFADKNREIKIELSRFPDSLWFVSHSGGSHPLIMTAVLQ